MELSRYVEELRQHLLVAAGAGPADEASGWQQSALTKRLAGAIEPATRLILFDALSAAADEITTDLAPGSVEVRLRGRDISFVVTSPPSDLTSSDGSASTPPAASSPAPVDGDDGATARITLRLPEHLKPQLEQAAARDGMSVNAWLVRTVGAALEGGPTSRPGSPRSVRGGTHITGWAR